MGPLALAIGANAFGRLAGPTGLVTHVSTTASTPTSTTTSHTAVTPAGATAGRYAIVELGMAVNPGIANSVAVVTPPAGWTLLASGNHAGTPAAQYAQYGKFLTGSDSWTFTYDVTSNVVSEVRLFDGVNTSMPVDTARTSWLASTVTATTRVTPTITTPGSRYLIYSCHDKAGSTGTVAPDAGTILTSAITSSASLSTARAGTQAAGTYTYTFTSASNSLPVGASIATLRHATDGGTPIARRASGGISATSTTTATPTIPTNAVGDLLLLTVVTSGTPAATPTGFTALGSDLTSAAAKVYLYYQWVTSVQSGSVTVTMTASSINRCQITSYSGADTTVAPTSAAGGSNTASTTMTAPSLYFPGGYGIWVNARSAASTMNAEVSEDGSWVASESIENSGTNAMTVLDGPLNSGVRTLSGTSSASVTQSNMVVGLAALLTT